MTTVTSTENYPALVAALVVEFAAEKLEEARVDEASAVQSLVDKMAKDGAASGISWNAASAVGAETARRLWESFVGMLTGVERGEATVETAVEAAKRTAMQIACSVCRSSQSTSLFSNTCDHAKAEAAVGFFSPGFVPWASVDNIVHRAESRAKQKVAAEQYGWLAKLEREKREASDKLGRVRSDSGKAKAQEAFVKASLLVDEAREDVLVKLREAGWQGTEVY